MLTYIINHLHVSVAFATIISLFYCNNDTIPEYLVVQTHMSFVTYITYLCRCNTLILYSYFEQTQQITGYIYLIKY